MKFLILKLIVLAMLLSTTASAGTPRTPLTVNGTRVVSVYGPMTGRSMVLFMNNLDVLYERDKEAPIDIILDSPGGDLFYGYLAVDKMESLRRQGIKFRCFVRSFAASMAFQMLLHCDERYAAPHAAILWHPVRVFWMGPLTAADASVMMTQLNIANQTVLDDLREHLPLPDEQLMWHFEKETLHHARELDKLAPGFFDYVGYNIVNLYLNEGVSDEEDEDTENKLNIRSIIYMHEMFLK